MRGRTSRRGLRGLRAAVGVGLDLSWRGNDKSILFDGVDEDLRKLGGGRFLPDYDQPWTVGIWAKASLTTGVHIFAYFGVYDGFSPGGLVLLHLNSRFRVGLRSPTLANGRLEIETAAAVGGVFDGAWHSYVATYDGSNTAAGIKLYFDGTLVSDVDTNDTAFTQSLDDGQGLVSIASQAVAVPGNPLYFPGSLDEAALWSREMAAPEIATKFGTAPADLTDDSGLLLWYRLGDAPDTTTRVFDRVGDRHLNGTNLEAADIEADVP